MVVGSGPGAILPLLSRLSLLISTLVFFQPAAVFAEPAPDQLTIWLDAERAKLETHLAEDQTREIRIKDTLQRAQSIQTKAYTTNDRAAQPIADHAVAKAKAALEKAREATRQDETTLRALNVAITLNKECAELRARANQDREALRRQLKASELISEGSRDQPTLIGARSGLVASKLAILANKFTSFNRFVVTLTQNIQFLKEHATELGPAVPAAGMTNVVTTWNVLNAGRSIEHCANEFKTVTTYSRLREKLQMTTQCAKTMTDAAEFFNINKPFIEKAGKLLGVGVPIVELANETLELREDLHGLEEFTRTYPEEALEAARRLDEAQKETLQRIADCHEKFARTLILL